MINKRLTNICYVLVIAMTIAVALFTKDIRNITFGLSALMIMYASFTFLFSYFDERVKSPECKIEDGVGDQEYVVIVSSHTYGINPFYVYSGSDRIAELYRGCEERIFSKPETPVIISREPLYEAIGTHVQMKPGCINYVCEKDRLANIVVDFYDSKEEIDESRYMDYYERIKKGFVKNDVSNYGLVALGIIGLICACW